jgi:hypothetical protein
MMSTTISLMAGAYFQHSQQPHKKKANSFFQTCSQKETHSGITTIENNSHNNQKKSTDASLVKQTAASGSPIQQQQQRRIICHRKEVSTYKNLPKKNKNYIFSGLVHISANIVASHKVDGNTFTTTTTDTFFFKKNKKFLDTMFLFYYRELYIYR